MMSRVEEYRFELLNLRDESLGPLDGITGGTLDYSIYDTIKSGGQIVYHGPPRDWTQHRIRVTFHLTEAGETRSWPLGVFLPAAPTAQHSDGDVETPLDLYDKLLVLVEDTYPNTNVVPAGVNIAAHVEAIIRNAGEPNVLITPTSETVRSDMIFEPGTTRLQVINKILEAANYGSLWCDGNGQYRAEPYRAPQYRPLAHEFASGDAALHSPLFTVDENTFSVPNRLTLVARTDGDVPALTSTRTLDALAPGHPLTQARRGRWVSQVVQDVEATSQAALDAMCERRLLLAANIATTLEISHAHLPLALNDRIRFTSDASGRLVDVECTLTKQTITLTPGELVRSTLRGIVE